MTSSTDFSFGLDPFWKYVMDDDSSVDESDETQSSLDTENTMENTTESKRREPFTPPKSKRRDATRDDVESRVEDQSQRQDSRRLGRKSRRRSRESADEWVDFDKDAFENSESFDVDLLNEYSGTKVEENSLRDGEVRNGDTQTFGIWKIFDFANNADSDHFTEPTDGYSTAHSETTDFTYSSTTSEGANEDDVADSPVKVSKTNDSEQVEEVAIKYQPTLLKPFIQDLKNRDAAPSSEEKPRSWDKHEATPPPHEPTLSPHAPSPSCTPRWVGLRQDPVEGDLVDKQKTSNTKLSSKKKQKSKQKKKTQKSTGKTKASTRQPKSIEKVKGEEQEYTSKSCLPIKFRGKSFLTAVYEKPLLDESKNQDRPVDKSCLPVQLHGRSSDMNTRSLTPTSLSEHSQPTPSPHMSFRKLLCRSQKLPEPQGSVGQTAAVKSTVAKSSATKSAEAFPLVRIISDTQGPQKTVAGKATNQKDLMKRISESSFASTSGPQSIFTYEYDSGTPMDVSYKTFGSDPVALMSVRQYDIPRTIYGTPGEAVVKIEASTISASDCKIRQGLWWGTEAAPLPNTPGVDMVGKIEKIDASSTKKHNLMPGDRVMSLCQWGGNSRYARISANQLVKVPEVVDPAEAVCLAEAYLAAFQALLHTQVDSTRYNSQSLIGQAILVIGATTNNVGRAVIEVARALGAMEVFALGKEKHHLVLESYGATPLSRKTRLWPNGVLGMMDLVIDASGDSTSGHASLSHFSALHEQGDLVFIGLRSMADFVAEEWDSAASLIDEEVATHVLNHTHSLEVFENWEFDLDRSKRDLEFLLSLLEMGKLKPMVRDRLPLSKVAKAQACLEIKHIQGHLVCEPWMKSKSRAVYL